MHIKVLNNREITYIEAGQPINYSIIPAGNVLLRYDVNIIQENCYLAHITFNYYQW